MGSPLGMSVTNFTDYAANGFFIHAFLNKTVLCFLDICIMLSM